MSDTPHTPHPKSWRKSINWTAVWVFAGAMSSGGLMVLTLTTFLGAYRWSFLSSGSTTFIANTIWPFICLGYLAFQVVPMIVRYQTQGWDVAVDQISTIVAFMGSVAVLTMWLTGYLTVDAAGWRIFFQTLLTHVVDLLLLLAGNKMIAAARGAEEKRIPS